jgi:hypothetical protein
MRESIVWEIADISRDASFRGERESRLWPESRKAGARMVPMEESSRAA